ncbi:MAG: FAD-dependent oxidoreductase, partial [Myxococcota bacterium]
MTSVAARDKTARLGILGGGPAGLSTALYLQQQGYTNLTVLEKSGAVGGKALTVDIDDGDGTVKNYELGAEYITYTYDHIWALVELLGEKTEDAAAIEIINRAGATPRFVQPTAIAPWYEVITASLKYLWHGYANIDQIVNPSNVGVASNPLLSMRTSEFIRTYGLESLAGFFLVKQFGYGTFYTFPVINLYRTVQPRMMLRILGGQIPIVKHLFKRPIAAMAVDGTQGLFKKLAAYLDARSDTPVVHVNKEVTRIEPTDDGTVTLTVNDSETHTFDALIVAIPPNLLLELMDEQDLSEGQRELFPKFQFHPYYVGTFETLDQEESPLPKAYFNNIWPDKQGDKEEPEPVQFTKRWDDTNIVARGYNWNYADDFPRGDTARIEEVFKTFMQARMNVSKFRLLDEDKYWPTYHPHVTMEDLQAGFYDTFDRLQGERNFFYVGSAISFESMEETVAYCKQLVETH